MMMADSSWEMPVFQTAAQLLLLRQRLSVDHGAGIGSSAIDPALDALLYQAQVKLGQAVPLEMDRCPCERPELGRHEKPRAAWLCRAAYLEKEIGYAISELGRGGEWPAAGMQRLEKLTS
jgi:hypothetical protein